MTDQNTTDESKKDENTQKKKELQKIEGTWKYHGGKGEYVITETDGKLKFKEDEVPGEMIEVTKEHKSAKKVEGRTIPEGFDANYFAKLGTDGDKGELWFDTKDVGEDKLRTVFRSKVEVGKRSPTKLAKRPTFAQKMFPFLKSKDKDNEKSNKKKDNKDDEKSKEEENKEPTQEEKDAREKFGIWIVHGGDYLDWAISPGKKKKIWLTVPDIHPSSVQMKEIDDTNQAPNDFPADEMAELPNKDLMWFDYNDIKEKDEMSYIYQGKVVTASQNEENLEEPETTEKQTTKKEKFFACCRPKVERERELRSLGRDDDDDKFFNRNK